MKKSQRRFKKIALLGLTGLLAASLAYDEATAALDPDECLLKRGLF